MQKILVIAGPTASGKSAVAVKIAQNNDAVIINCDSVQLYKGLDIITSQPSEDDFKNYDYRLYKILEPYEHFSVADYKMRAEEEIAKVLSEKKLAIIVGGTGLYLNALINGISAIPNIPTEIRAQVGELFAKIGNKKFFQQLQQLDKEAAIKLNMGDTQRVKRAYEVKIATGKSIYEFQQEKMPNIYSKEQYQVCKLIPDREFLYSRINRRFDDMLENGAIDELKLLISKYPVIDNSLLKAAGVPELLLYIEGKITLEEAITIAKQKTRNYAKRQYTWFRNQLEGETVTYSSVDEMLEVVSKVQQR